MKKILLAACAVVALATPAWASNGGPGPDRIIGTPHSNVLRGGGGSDVIHSGRGHDVVFGGPGFDVCYVQAADVVHGCEVEV